MIKLSVIATLGIRKKQIYYLYMFIIVMGNVNIGIPICLLMWLQLYINYTISYILR